MPAPLVVAPCGIRRHGRGLARGPDPGAGRGTLGLTSVGIYGADRGRAAGALGHVGVRLAVPERIADARGLRPDIVADCTTPNARLAIAREATLGGARNTASLAVAFGARPDGFGDARLRAAAARDGQEGLTP